MSGRENNFGGLEARLRSEPIEGEGLSDMARARLRERLACTAPEPGRPPSALAGRGALIAAVLVIGGVVGAVVVSQRNAAIEAARQEPAMVDESTPNPGLREQLRQLAGGVADGVSRESPLFEEARRMATDVGALRGVFRSRAATFGWNPPTDDG